MAFWICYSTVFGPKNIVSWQTFFSNGSSIFSHWLHDLDWRIVVCPSVHPSTSTLSTHWLNLSECQRNPPNLQGCLNMAPLHNWSNCPSSNLPFSGVCTLQNKIVWRTSRSYIMRIYIYMVKNKVHIIANLCCNAFVKWQNVRLMLLKYI